MKEKTNYELTNGLDNKKYSSLESLNDNVVSTALKLNPDLIVTIDQETGMKVLIGEWK